MKLNFVCAITFSLPAAGLFSRSRLRGTQGAHVQTKAQVWVPAALRGACSGRKNREIWQVIAGLLSDQLEQARPMQTPKTCFFFPPSFFHLSAVLVVPQS